jgi:membrane protein DedA with SNARE-associated domain
MSYYLAHITYPILFVAVLARQLDLPVPALLFLLAGGALAGAGKLNVVGVLLVAVLGCLSADLVWFEAGRLRGKRVLRVLCALTSDPSFCIRRGREIFAKKGLRLLLIAKFVPGLDGICPPLAGTLGVSRAAFLVHDAGGASLWAGAYIGCGFLFARQLDKVAQLRCCHCAGSDARYSASNLLRLETCAASADNPAASTAADPSRTVEVAIGFGGEILCRRPAAL